MSFGKYDAAFLPTIDKQDMCVGWCFAVVNTVLGNVSLSYISQNKEDALKQLVKIKKESPGAKLSVEECDAGITFLPVYQVKVSAKSLLLFMNNC